MAQRCFLVVRCVGGNDSQMGSVKFCEMWPSGGERKLLMVNEDDEQRKLQLDHIFILRVTDFLLCPC